MAHPDYLWRKALKLRSEQHLSIDQLATQLGLPKTTIYYWVRNIPLGRPRRSSPGQRLGNRRMQAKYRQLREEAYARGREEFSDLARDPEFRDFVCLYIAEGYKRNRNTVSLCNSDAAVMKLAAKWICHFTRRKVTYHVQYHADQNLEGLQAYWAAALGIDSESVQLQRKSNSNRLSGRSWRSVNGVLDVRTFDTLFRARLQGWIDCLEALWLDSHAPGA